MSEFLWLLFALAVGFPAVMVSAAFGCAVFVRCAEWIEEKLSK